MDHYTVVWLGEDKRHFDFSQQIATELSVSLEMFDSESACYKYILSNPVDLVILDQTTDARVLDKLQFIRSILKHIVVIIFCDKKDCQQNLFYQHGADYVFDSGFEKDVFAVVIRRSLERSVPKPANNKRSYIENGWKLDVSSSLIVSPDGKTLKLTLTERDFFKVFYENYGEVCSFETIAGHLGIDPNEAYRHRIEVILSRLRRKFTKSLFYELPIKSIRGVGYVLAFENRDKKIDLSDQHAFISAQAQWAKSSARVA